MKNNPFSNISLWIMLSLTLGLAPFFPEPHIWGKLKWIAGGAVGMTPMDWFDVLLHGLPWVGLVVAVMVNVSRKKEA
ncbi:MAG: hypothetical protein SF052_10375 [Bacteroidia bacterium]|nr:hypothetical protein [Bacteroidia bacterium]